MTSNSKLFVCKKYLLAALCLIVLTQIGRAQSGWNLVQRGGSGDLVSVFFTSSEKGWIGGDDGYLAKTSDGGKSWVRQTLNSKENVNEIYFRNDDNGYLLA